MHTLASGAGMAGPDLAAHLAVRGHRVSVVERSAFPPVTGSPIDN
ncbi:hypothetical protein [Streptomyces sp. NPDC015125]